MKKCVLLLLATLGVFCGATAVMRPVVGMLGSVSRINAIVGNPSARNYHAGPEKPPVDEEYKKGMEILSSGICSFMDAINRESLNKYLRKTIRAEKKASKLINNPAVCMHEKDRQQQEQVKRQSDFIEKVSKDLEEGLQPDCALFADALAAVFNSEGAPSDRKLPEVLQKYFDRCTEKD